MNRIKGNGKEIYEVLAKNLEINDNDFAPVVAMSKNNNPFSILVSIILSQNTTDKNAIKAFNNLYEKTGLDPEKIVDLGVDNVSEIIRTAGLPKQKSHSIIELAKFVKEKGEKYLLEKDPLQLKNELMRIPGIGEKTSDVFLSFTRNYPVFPVDTHIRRIALRWGLSDKNSYKSISQALIEFFGPDLSNKAHKLLITFGRIYCKAKNPRCKECFLKEICPSAQI
ncbi:endonuclease III domain-containing protein [Caldisphaera lagunensis]|uniref:endonuclease III domain-containing protein n=1 Tax=Caldisphaera lagunensis TaxID=200415 RepID=UPI000662B95F|nr:endonuclease III [Caldisphaera lagunensis]